MDFLQEHIATGNSREIIREIWERVGAGDAPVFAVTNELIERRRYTYAITATRPTRTPTFTATGPTPTPTDPGHPPTPTPTIDATHIARMVWQSNANQVIPPGVRFSGDQTRHADMKWNGFQNGILHARYTFQFHYWV
ncbi:MAG: hypothetical protein ACOYYS_11390, partial [Chloroflexota bacterium]